MNWRVVVKRPNGNVVDTDVVEHRTAEGAAALVRGKWEAVRGPLSHWTFEATLDADPNQGSDLWL